MVKTNLRPRARAKVAVSQSDADIEPARHYVGKFNCFTGFLHNLN